MCVMNEILEKSVDFVLLCVCSRSRMVVFFLCWGMGGGGGYDFVGWMFGDVFKFKRASAVHITTSEKESEL